MVTPIQIIRAIAAIFTGYLVKPRIIAQETVEQTTIAITAETRTILQKSMELAVKHGTGHLLKSVPDLEIYAKTSTAQTSSLSKRLHGPKFFAHGWFVAYFRYQENRPMVCLTLVENTGSARNAAEIAKNFLIGYKQHIDTLKTT